MASTIVQQAVDSFLSTLYGQQNFERWKELKLRLCCSDDQDFVEWMLDATECYYSNKNTTPNRVDTGLDAAKEKLIEKFHDSPNLKNEDSVDFYNDDDTSSLDIPGINDDDDDGDVMVEGDRMDGKLDQFLDNPLLMPGNGEAPLKGEEREAVNNENIQFIDDDVSLADSEAKLEIDLGLLKAPRLDESGMILSDDSEDDDGDGESPLKDVLLPGSTTISRGQPGICPYCCKEFHSRRYLRSHISVVHLNVRSHQCKLCLKNFSTKQNLKTHMQAVHMKLRPHSCERCAKCFSHRHHLRRHMTTCQRIAAFRDT